MSILSSYLQRNSASLYETREQSLLVEIIVVEHTHTERERETNSKIRTQGMQHTYVYVHKNGMYTPGADPGFGKGNLKRTLCVY